MKKRDEIYMKNYRVWNPQRAPEESFWFFANAVAKAYEVALETKRETVVTLDYERSDGTIIRSKKVVIIRGAHLKESGLQGRQGKLES